MYKNLFLFVCLLPVLIITAQDKTGTIHGIVVEEGAGTPVQFINVLLLNAADSVLVAGTATDKKGMYEFTHVADGSYLLKFTCIGFTTKIRSGLEVGSGHRKISIENTAMAFAMMETKQVIISGQKELINNSVDRKVYNVEKDVMAKSGTAADLLQNIPSVGVDIDGNVSLRGSQNVMILINGKTSPLMDKASATVLDELPANAIERIEVITNPSAAYKPDGTSGIINIVLKKDKGLGWNGNMTLNMGNNSRYNTNFSFNYNPGKLNLFSSFSFRQDDRKRISSDSREETNESGIKSFYTESGTNSGRPIVCLAKLGGDYALSMADKVGLEGDLFYQDATRTGSTNSTWFDAVHAVTKDYDRNRRSPQIEKEYSGAISYTHNFGREDHDLDIDIKYSEAPEREQNYYTNIYRVPVQPNDIDNDRINIDEKVTEFNAKYKYPVSEDAVWETGYSGELKNSCIDLYKEYFDYARGALMQDLTRSSIFKLTTSINAAYATYAGKFGAWGVKAGLRAEQADLQPDLTTLQKKYTNSYFSLFPTLHIKYRLSSVSSLQINYSKRVRRPQEDDLNPFPEYQDPRNVRAGNPDLKPEYINSIECGIQWNTESFSLIPSVYYRFTNNRFTQITRWLNDTTLLTTQHNLNTEKAGGIEVVASASVPNLCNIQISLNGYYNEIDASNLGYTVPSSAYAWSGNGSINWTLTKTTMLQVNGIYRSLRLTPQGENSPAYGINAGMKQELMDERITLTVSVSDIFNTMKFKNVLNTDMLKDTAERRRDGRVAYIGLTWHMGSGDKRKDKIEYDNE